MISDLDLAVYNSIHDFKGGAKALATHLSVKPGTLSNKADPSIDTHHLNVSEALAIMLASEDYRILYALAGALHHSCIPLPDYSLVSDVELLNAYTHFHAEVGQTALAINDALKDGRILRAEYRRIRREGLEDIQAFFELLQRLEALIDD